MTRFTVLDPQNIGAFTSQGTLRTIDISDFDGPNDYLSVALPAFPLASINLSQTFIDVSSNPDGQIDTGPTDSAAFSASTATLISGNCELRIPLSAFPNIDKSAITGIRFRVKATTNCTFRAMAIRAMSGNWTYGPVDINTLYNRAESCVSPKGSLTQAYDFPTSSLPGYENWPIIYSSDTPTGVADPRPIDSSIGMAFFSGSLSTATGTNYNNIALYIRELSVAEQIQLNLNGQTQEQLNSLQHSLDFDTEVNLSRTQKMLEPLPQNILDQQSQSDLEHSENYVTKAWIEIRLKWKDTLTTLTIKDANGIGYTFTVPTIIPNTNYLLLLDCKENSIRVKIYSLDGQGRIVQPVIYDTGTIKDINLFKRRKGRVGWWASFADGDAYINNIRPRGLNFGEFTSKTYTSLTPVDGARLFAEASPDVELFTGVGAGPWGGGVITDVEKSRSGKSYKVTTTAGQPLQGVKTNNFYLDDFDQTEINFDIFFPPSNDGLGSLNILLVGELGLVVQLKTPPIRFGQWSHITIQPSHTLLQTGVYSLVVVQSISTLDSVWYLDNISIKTRSIKWSARGKKKDPWSIYESPWIPFKSTLNQSNDGVLFERGNQLQIRGQARRQGASINKIKTIPRYSTLGNFKWPDQVPTFGTAPSPSITITNNSSRLVKMNALASTGSIAYYRWSFGDGSVGYGPYATYTYESSGSYTVTLTVTSYTGQSISTTTTISV